MTAYAMALASFLAGLAIGYLLASKRASQREHPVEFGDSFDFGPCQRARNWEGQ